MTGKCAFGCAERELIVAGGTRQLRVTARESAKPAVTRPWSSRLSTSVDDGKGASGPERGARFLRGEDSEGRNPRNGCGMQQGREARVGQETAERLRKPVSGTEVGLDNPPHMGLTG